MIVQFHGTRLSAPLSTWHRLGGAPHRHPSHWPAAATSTRPHARRLCPAARGSASAFEYDETTNPNWPCMHRNCTGIRYIKQGTFQAFTARRIRNKRGPEGSSQHAHAVHLPGTHASLAHQAADVDLVMLHRQRQAAVRARAQPQGRRLHAAPRFMVALVVEPSGPPTKLP